MITIPIRDAGTWKAAATVEKFNDEQSANRYNDALIAISTKHKLSLAEVSSMVRAIVEKYWDNAFALADNRGGVIDAFIKINTTAMRKLSECELDMDMLSAISLMQGLSLGAKNGLLNEGINELFTLICTTSAADISTGNGYRWNNTYARIGVGDNNASGTNNFVATQTGVQASTNKLYKGMVAGFPTFGTSQLAVWKSQYTGAEANFHWYEWSIDNGGNSRETSTVDTTAKNLNRKVEDLGIKSSGATWSLQTQITLT